MATGSVPRDGRAKRLGRFSDDFWQIFGEGWRWLVSPSFWGGWVGNGKHMKTLDLIWKRQLCWYHFFGEAFHALPMELLCVLE